MIIRLMYAACWAAFGPAAVVAQDAPLAQLFAQRPEISKPVVSPNGDFIAYASDRDGASRVIVLHIASGERFDGEIEDSVIDGIYWTDNSTILVERADWLRLWRLGQARGTFYSQVNLIRDETETLTGLEVYDYETSGRFTGFDPEDGVGLIRFIYGGWDQAELLGCAPNSEHGCGRRNYGDRDTENWFLDAEGDIVARLDYSNRHNRYRIVLRTDDDIWPTLREFADRPLLDLESHGTLPDGRLVVATRNMPETGLRTESLYALSPTDGSLQDTLSTHPELDIARVVYETHGNTPVGAFYQDETPYVDWFDEGLAEIQRTLDARYPDTTVTLLNWSIDRDVIVAERREGSAPVEYFALNLNTDQITSLGSTHPALTQRSIPAREPYDISARDTQSIPGYLTLPDSPGPHPTVILSHSWTNGVFNGGFDPLAQFLASLGYAVYQPNARGSTGYGLEWLEAGYGEWGFGVRQNDLLDSAQALIQAGIAEPGKVCMVGGGYGGYASVMGAILHPDQIACAAVFGAILDTERWYRQIEDYVGRDSAGLHQRKLQLLGPDTRFSREAIRRLSPMEYINAETAPIFVMHGTDDEGFNFVHTRHFVRHAQRRNARIQLEILDDVGAGHESADATLAWFEALETFLAEHIGE
ncbi:MAG: prolyl oligopeptidase family serine peptidase [Maricaulis sp.]|uniref:alpha/beta hydrolase family protein n=1 Tax=Maricaulis sp. TaxID=1486257 RepID=UPI002609C2F2|nr:prolyl oligopeptidase family serine peptidase [Maricaulis sp.]MDM7983314.1 prolyl oligopeptidase family serine peptidase [Maricaulis sp.]